MEQRRAIPLLVGLSLFGSAACEPLGFVARVLHKVPSPDGRFVAVCQEVPVYDGPDYELRLETPGGTRVKTLYVAGSGDGCNEVVWSTDSSTLGVLSQYAARVALVDVRAALQSDWIEGTRRRIELGVGGRIACNLALPDRTVLHFETAARSDAVRDGNGQWRCIANVTRHRLPI